MRNSSKLYHLYFKHSLLAVIREDQKWELLTFTYNGSCLLPQDKIALDCASLSANSEPLAIEQVLDTEVDLFRPYILFVSDTTIHLLALNSGTFHVDHTFNITISPLETQFSLVNGPRLCSIFDIDSTIPKSSITFTTFETQEKREVSLTGTIVTAVPCHTFDVPILLALLLSKNGTLHWTWVTDPRDRHVTSGLTNRLLLPPSQCADCSVCIHFHGAGHDESDSTPSNLCIGIATSKALYLVKNGEILFHLSYPDARPTSFTMFENAEQIIYLALTQNIYQDPKKHRTILAISSQKENRIIQEHPAGILQKGDFLHLGCDQVMILPDFFTDTEADQNMDKCMQQHSEILFSSRTKCHVIVTNGEFVMSSAKERDADMADDKLRLVLPALARRMQDGSTKLSHTKLILVDKYLVYQDALEHCRQLAETTLVPSPIDTPTDIPLNLDAPTAVTNRPSSSSSTTTTASTHTVSNTRTKSIDSTHQSHPASSSCRTSGCTCPCEHLVPLLPESAQLPASVSARMHPNALPHTPPMSRKNLTIPSLGSLHYVCPADGICLISATVKITKYFGGVITDVRLHLSSSTQSESHALSSAPFLSPNGCELPLAASLRFSPRVTDPEVLIHVLLRWQETLENVTTSRMSVLTSLRIPPSVIHDLSPERALVYFSGLQQRPLTFYARKHNSDLLPSQRLAQALDTHIIQDATWRNADTSSPFSPITSSTSNTAASSAPIPLASADYPCQLISLLAHDAQINIWCLGRDIVIAVSPYTHTSSSQQPASSSSTSFSSPVTSGASKPSRKYFPPSFFVQSAKPRTQDISHSILHQLVSALQSLSLPITLYPCPVLDHAVWEILEDSLFNLEAELDALRQLVDVTSGPLTVGAKPNAVRGLDDVTRAELCQQVLTRQARTDETMASLMSHVCSQCSSHILDHAQSAAASYP